MIPHRKFTFDFWALTLVFAALPLRFALAVRTCLSPDEAYYLAAHRLGFTITDHPPLTTWLVGLADNLDFLSLELRIRLPALVVGTFIPLLLLWISKTLHDQPSHQRWTALLGAFLPLPLAGGFLITPDTPLLLAVAVLLVIHHQTPSWKKNVGLIFACAWGLAAKVSMLVPGLLLLFLSPHRSERLAVAMGMAIALPIALPSLGFQWHHAFVDQSSAVGTLTASAAALGAQLLLWTPAVLWFGFREAWPRPFERGLMLSMSVLLLASALLRQVPPEPNWFAVAALFCIPFAAGPLARGARWVQATTLLLGPAAALLFASHVLWPWLPIPTPVDPSARLHGWRDDNPVAQAPGIGVYGPAAEACIYQKQCEKIAYIFNNYEQFFK
ncbi:MAG TPA: hypothetical protein PKL73_20070 [Polyangiaceae bacterium]|jgi:hypothetical protein|nr:MAG: hypothetical protein BWY17_00484 [Deltaproteobacteria bacterium ADurb.Bin207]HNS99266.1 hypothetical protein [Polyangiaceae bacterium]HNZ20890.1 hypothetical protein [Polyangiaceae bacterium]HOD21463.1 hypothetical protein [Polyangiaceae bacterium]HOE47571.1 hypothetical protein [Polyangiaceae bacterium]